MTDMSYEERLACAENEGDYILIAQNIAVEADATIKEQAAEIERLKSPWVSVDDYGFPSDEVTECIVLVRVHGMTHPVKKLDEWCPKSCTFDQWPSELVVEWMPIPPI